ncbi:hypothetical protein ABID97_003626 [Variovorax sp. OAS795]|uniref:hypothetical protein n=1 Tax=Variovorax sp. OAS795 TaxID=3034231 RepID=UPI003394BC06
MRESRSNGSTIASSDLAKVVKAGSLLIGGITVWVGAAAVLAKEAYDAWVKARDSGLNVMQISNTEASQLSFPPGHPRPGTLYVAHPATSTVYYTTAMFHRMAFEHKFTEAVELLMSLGASHIEVEHVHGWSREFSATMATLVPTVSAEASASSNTARSSSLLFKADFDNDHEPSVPSDLAWYAHEPTWRSIAHGRLKYGMKEFSLGVSYQDDYGVNAGLKLKAEKAGLDMGGAFEDHLRTTWTISGSFNECKGKP